MTTAISEETVRFWSPVLTIAVPYCRSIVFDTIKNISYITRRPYGSTINSHRILHIPVGSITLV